jgi:hypothetical protein
VSRFTGPQFRGALRHHREQARTEAEERNARTHPDDRRVTREGPPGTRAAARRAARS